MRDVAALLAALADRRKAVQRPAAEALAARLGEEPALRGRVSALLRAAEPHHRWAAAYALALAERAPLDAVPVLLEALGTGDGDVRWASATVLVRLAAAEPSVRERVRALVGDPSPLRRKMALYCLRDTGVRDDTTEAEITAALGDDDVGVRLAALGTLAVLTVDPARAAAGVAPLLRDGDAGVRRAAAVALGRIGADTALARAALAGAAGSADDALRRAAVAALSRLDASAGHRG